MQKTPLGVMILGFIALLKGVVGVFYGCVFVGLLAFEPAVSGEGFGFAGALAIVVGLVYIAVAFAAWSLQPWAWLFGMIMALVGIVEAIVVLIASNDLAYGVAAALLPLVMLWYLNQERVKEAFGADEA
jgi:hypothetical protein